MRYANIGKRDKNVWQPVIPQPSKYRNKRTNGYASKKEAARAQILKAMEINGEIQNLREQVPFELIPKQDGERACKYIADFVYERGGQTVVEDCKGFKNRVYLLKRKLLKWRFGISVVET